MSERFVKMSDATGDVLPKASTTVDFTLDADNWTDPSGSETYYVQTVTGLSSLITATVNGVMGLDIDATHAEYEAAADAQLRCTAQAAGSITVKAKSKPSIDIPCTIILLG